MTAESERERLRVESAIGLRSPDPLVREQAEAMTRKLKVDWEIATLRAEMATIFAGGGQHRERRLRLAELGVESQQLQSRLGWLRRLERQQNRARELAALQQAVQELLPTDKLEDVRARAGQIVAEMEERDHAAARED